MYDGLEMIDGYNWCEIRNFHNRPRRSGVKSKRWGDRRSRTSKHHTGSDLSHSAISWAPTSAVVSKVCVAKNAHSAQLPSHRVTPSPRDRHSRDFANDESDRMGDYQV